MFDALSSRVALVAALLGLVATSCASDSEALSLGEYERAVNSIEADFVADFAALGDGPEAFAHQVNGELVGATAIFDLYEERVARLRAVTPPADLEDAHAELVATMDEMQTTVAAYLSESGMSGEEFAVESIGRHPEIEPLLVAAQSACISLRALAASQLDLDLEMADGCSM